MIGKIPEPMLDTRAQPDSQHSAGLELALSQQTETLVYRCSGGTRSWCWGMPGEPDAGAWTVHAAPTANITANATWTDMVLGALPSGTQTVDTFSVPWRLAESHTKLLVYATLVTNAQVYFQFRVQTESLVDAVAGTDGEVAASQMPRASLDMFGWKDLNHAAPNTYRSATYYCWIEPTLPASRVVAVVPQVYLDEERSAQIDLSGTVYVWMSHLHILDIPDIDTVGT